MEPLRRLPLWRWVVLLGVLVSSAPAAAQTPPPPAPPSQSAGGPSPRERGRARRDFDRALSLAEGERDYESALVLFRRSYDLLGDKAILWNIAECYRNLRRYREAIDTLEKYRTHPNARPTEREQGAREIQELKRKLAHLVVRANFDGARISLNGVLAGQSPLDTYVNPGAYVLEVSSAGFEVQRQQLQLEASQERQVQINLRTLPATLTVTSVPTGAWVAIKGIPTGATPLTTQVTAGSAVLEVYKTGFRTEQRTIEAGAGQAVSVQVRLEPEAGLLDVEVNQRGARVTVDSAPLGEAPLPVQPLSPGRRRLAVRLPGFDTWSGEIQVADGQKADLRVELQRGSLHPRWFGVAAGLSLASLAAAAGLLGDASRRSGEAAALELRLIRQEFPLRDVTPRRDRVMALQHLAIGRTQDAVPLLVTGALLAVTAGVVAYFTRWRASKATLRIDGRDPQLEGRWSF